MAHVTHSNVAHVVDEKECVVNESDHRVEERYYLRRLLCLRQRVELAAEQALVQQRVPQKQEVYNTRVHMLVERMGDELLVVGERGCKVSLGVLFDLLVDGLSAESL